jgi:hypothetical protein
MNITKAITMFLSFRKSECCGVHGIDQSVKFSKIMQLKIHSMKINLELEIIGYSRKSPFVVTHTTTN